MSQQVLRFENRQTGERLEVTVGRLLIAGFTGRNEAAVMHHIEELKAIGVPTPDSVPTFYELDPALLTQEDRVTVAGTFSSGEVEPVVVVAEGKRWLTVGSDHTDRDMEREGILVSKAACPKPIATSVVPLPGGADWDQVAIRSFRGADRVEYQAGTLAEIRTLDDLERALKAEGTTLRDGDVLFLGTVPVIGGELVPSDRFEAHLIPPGQDLPMTTAYTIDVDVALATAGDEA